MPKSVGKDTLVRLASVHAAVHKHDFQHRRRDEDARPQAGFDSERLIHRARNCVQGRVETASGNDNRHLGRGPGGAMDRADRPRAVGGGGVVARAPVLDRNEIQGAQERGQTPTENQTDPASVERRRLARAATLPTHAAGSLVEDAQALKKSPSALRSPPEAAPERSRIVGALRLGLAALSRLLAKGRMCRRVRLLPEPWPPPPDGLKVVSAPKPQTYPCQPMMWERICRSPFMPDFVWRYWLKPSGFPPSRE